MVCVDTACNSEITTLRDQYISARNLTPSCCAQQHGGMEWALGARHTIDTNREEGCEGEDEYHLPQRVDAIDSQHKL